jgi:hypothetical protein
LNELTVTEYRNIRVLTTQQIAEAYGADAQVITNNFNRNKERYVEGKHFICLTGEELKEFKTKNQNDLSSRINQLYLWTEKGAFLHAKSLNTDKAWEVYDCLVDNYFNKRKPLTALEQLQLTQQAVLEVKEQIDSVDRDLQEFKRDMPLLALECQRITRAKNQKIVPLLGGKDSAAYKNSSLRKKVYTDIDSQIRRHFGVNTYKAIKRNQCDLAIELINQYTLPLVLEEQIESENSQISFI